MITKAGLIKTTLINYPGKVASAIFLPGCNFRCPYCHNPELVLDKADDLVSVEDIFNHLEKRKKIIEGVCISGGEPLIHEDIEEFIKKIRAMGYLIKLDTNGSFPEKIMKIRPDYIAMDIKTSPEKYSLVEKNGGEATEEKILESIAIIKNSGIPHEFRTTLAPGIAEAPDIEKICSLLHGAMLYVLAAYVPGHNLSKKYDPHPYSSEQINAMAQIVKEHKIPFKLRNIN